MSRDLCKLSPKNFDIFPLYKGYASLWALKRCRLFYFIISQHKHRKKYHKAIKIHGFKNILLLFYFSSTLHYLPTLSNFSERLKLCLLCKEMLSTEVQRAHHYKAPFLNSCYHSLHRNALFFTIICREDSYP